MRRFLFGFIVLALFALLSLRDAHADSSKANRAAFALIVTSNHGVSGSRPDLHYADDDGVKYLELFKMLAPEANVILHTELDRDTERLYPWARTVARPPTKVAVAASIADLAQRIGAITRAGGASDLYFVFAGHGDVDAGVGFLELRDARFTSLDVESMLRMVGATRSHVVLDSCNSFFVMNARKPGGRPVATTADEARSLGERLPNVGVFLSTSAEAEVFEWSELQAGIFSHAVRSGLAGAADANGDGEVSYEELRAFVGVASARIKNPRYRPRVFARGPAANAGAPLVRLSALRGTALRIDGPQLRLTIRDGDEVPLVDLHKEDGAALTIRLPEQWAARAVVEERDATAQSQVVRRFSLEPSPDERPIVLSQLTPTSPVSEPRGASDVFRMLFAVPFGPKAMADTVPEIRKEDDSAVYGVSEDQIERMRILLAQASGDGQGRRVTIGAGDVTIGAVLGSAGGWLLTRDESSTKAYPYVLLGYGGLLTGLGALSLFRTSGEEDLYEAYALAIQSSDPRQRAMALATAERCLFALRRGARTRRIWLQVASFVFAGGAAGLFALNEVARTREDQNCFGTIGPGGSMTCTSTPSTSSDAVWAGRLTYGSLFALGTTMAVSSFVPYPVERIADVWESDPGRVRDGQDFRPNVAFAPLRGGGQLQLGWSF
ncbi:MAG TPA: hypothetical protein VJT73_04930 [Polyangiaceae bacterium]|nr:hypothetical protein [Polyangiaceae bacterium]